MNEIPLYIYNQDMAPSPQKPVLIIGFVRKEGLERTLLSLAQAGSYDVYLAIDGPKNQDQALLQLEMVLSAEKIALSSGMVLHVWRRKQNLGLAVSIITAIDWFFSKVEEGIILEDDLYFNENFINFTNSALDFFREDPDTWLISGNNFSTGKSLLATNSWSTYPLIWGWATWRSKWVVMRSELLSGNSLGRMSASLRVKNFWKTGYRRAITGRTDSWAAPLAAVQRANSKFTVVPNINLVSNIGNDVSAIHTSEGSPYMNLTFPNHQILFQFSDLHREEIADDMDAFLEHFVYKISWKNTFSYAAMLLFDGIRFPLKQRKCSLASRLNH